MTSRWVRAEFTRLKATFIPGCITSAYRLASIPSSSTAVADTLRAFKLHIRTGNTIIKRKTRSRVRGNCLGRPAAQRATHGGNGRIFFPLKSGVNPVIFRATRILGIVIIALAGGRIAGNRSQIRP